MGYLVTVAGRKLLAREGETLRDCLLRHGIFVDAPCSGKGTCGKCTVLVDGMEEKSCSYTVRKDILVEVPKKPAMQILSCGPSVAEAHRNGPCVAIDIGTTTLVCYLLSPAGKELAVRSMENPQRAFGADVVSRIQYSLQKGAEELTRAIRDALQGLIRECCGVAGIAPEEIRAVSVVGNSCMQQLFFGVSAENLARIPFAPVLTEAKILPAGAYLPLCAQAELLLVPDISGFVGADTVACILSSSLHKTEETVLLVDIGTNGEMVLCHSGRMVACATAAGPALEGAHIQFGMGGRPGAIDHVTETGCTVIGGGKAAGICGSGLVDAVAVLLNKGLLNRRGKLLTDEKIYPLADGVYLTQEDVRQVQLAKGAIAAGIECMASHLGIRVEQIDRCLLAGAFGTFLDPDQACRMGLLPEALQGKITALGNLAGAGSKLLALNPERLAEAGEIARNTESLELAQQPDFQRKFAKNMGFREEKWLVFARECGFQDAAYMDVSTLSPMDMVRKACSADQCRAYGKNWTCPPYCGTLEECAEKMGAYRHSILLQTVGKLEKTVDTKGYARAEKDHLSSFQAFCDGIRKEYPDALCLGSGGCRVCEKCAWPAPCRFPEKACSSMEAYGLFVTQVCRDNGLNYHHGEKTITYTACVLFNR